jgi:hypothetical protein
MLALVHLGGIMSNSTEETNPLANLIIKGLPNYMRIVCEILRHPSALSASFIIEDQRTLKKALSFVGYAIALIFVLMMPVFHKHNVDLVKFRILLIHYLFQLALFGSVAHVCLRFVGGAKKDFRCTLVAYCYYMSAFVPLLIMLHYPTFMSNGLNTLLDADTPDNPDGIFRLFILPHPDHYLSHHHISVFMAWLAIVTCPSWFSYTHLISKFRALLSMVIAGSTHTMIILLCKSHPFLDLYLGINTVTALSKIIGV